MIIRPHEPSQYLPANQYDAKLLSILHAGTKRRAEAVSRACDHCVASVPFDLGEALTSNPESLTIQCFVSDLDRPFCHP
jgi:hypothetical protein